MSSSRRTYFEEQIKSHSSGIRTLQRRLVSLGFIRFAAFCCIAVFIWLFIRTNAWSCLAAAGVFLVVFIGLVRLYFRLKDRRALLEKLLFVAQNELGMLQDFPNQLPDGAAWLDGKSYLDDLDIFGPRSVFHLLNRTSTSHGALRLADLLRSPLRSESDIREWQQAVFTLASQPESRAQLLAQGLLTGEKEGNMHSLGDWLNQPEQLMKYRILSVLRWALPIFNFAALIYYLATDKLVFLSLGIVVSWLITGYFAKYIGHQHALVGKKQAVLDQYAVILSVFNSMDAGQSDLLRRLREVTLPAHKSIHQLARLSGFLDQRLNAMVFILLNSFLLYDIQTMLALERWKEEHRDRFGDWIGAVGMIECFCSIAGYAYLNPDFCIPECIDTNLPVESAGGAQVNARPDADTHSPDQSEPAMHVHAGFGAAPAPAAWLRIVAKGLAHPLIPAKVRVPNDCDLGTQERLALVTGSNMSGKTTFLRTIGVNLLLAQCGAPVCAEKFAFTPMRLLTSLRVSDSLQEQTSYFMAELKKLQRIIHSLEKGEPALVLIDEILRGTNSEDKTYGSEHFIRKLLNYHALSLFATHDLSLGSLEQTLPGEISNYCFESVITNGELIFDYRLQKGIARNRNASFLMKKMDII